MHARPSRSAVISQTWLDTFTEVFRLNIKAFLPHVSLQGFARHVKKHVFHYPARCEKANLITLNTIAQLCRQYGL